MVSLLCLLAAGADQPAGDAPSPKDAYKNLRTAVERAETRADQLLPLFFLRRPGRGSCAPNRLPPRRLTLSN
jgi:hypothetical protein